MIKVNKIYLRIRENVFLLLSFGRDRYSIIVHNETVIVVTIALLLVIVDVSGTGAFLLDLLATLVFLSKDAQSDGERKKCKWR